MVCGIYKISNLVNGKSYIGQSVDILARWRRHKTDAFSNDKRTYNYPLYRAFRKYGVDNFSFEIIEECNRDNLNEREKYYINFYDSFNNGYNQDKGGTNSGHFSKLNQEKLQEIIHLLQTTQLTNAEIGEKIEVSENTICGINTGKKWKNDNISYPIRKKKQKSDVVTYQQLIKSSVKERPIENKHQKQQNLPNLDKKRESKCPDKEVLFDLLKEYQNFTAVARIFNVSDNAVRKWCIKYGIPSKTSEYKIYKKSTSTKENHTKQICMIDKNTDEILKFFDSIGEAERFLDIPHSNAHIVKVCKGERKTAYGYKWQYV